MTSRTNQLTLQDYKIVSLSLLGGALEVFDFIIFVFLAPTIADIFFPPETPAWIRLLESMTIFSVGYLARPIGGLIIAHFSDRSGRKHMFNLTVLLMAMPCLAIGLLPTYAQIGYWSPLLLLIARVTQGAALGGEVPNAWVFVAEHTPKKHRGYALGILQAGLTFGYMLAALTIAFINSVISHENMEQWGWRIPFIIGGVLGFISVWLRRWLHETPVFIAMKQRKDVSLKKPVSTIFSEHRDKAIPAFILTAVLTTTVIISVVVTPILLQKTWGFDPTTTFKISCLGILALNIGCIIAGRLADKLGAWKIFALYSVLMAIGASVMTGMMGHNIKAVIIGYIVMGLCSGVISAVPAVMVNLFPPAVKVTGISLIYNISYSIFSSVLPLIMLSLYGIAHWMLTAISWVISLAGIVVFQVYRKIPQHS